MPRAKTAAGAMGMTEDRFCFEQKNFDWRHGYDRSKNLDGRHGYDRRRFENGDMEQILMCHQKNRYYTWTTPIKVATSQEQILRRQLPRSKS